MKKYLVALLFLVQAPLASATSIYTSETDFLAHLQPGYYLENFDSYTYGNPLNGSQITQNYGPTNSYSWTASAIPNGLYSNNGALSTDSYVRDLAISFAGSPNPVTAFGGIFASTDTDGNVIPLAITLTLNDGTTKSLTGSGFLGFTSTTPFTSLDIVGIDGLNPEQNPQNRNWPAIDHIYVGTAIPEPTSLALLGLGGLLLAPWRRYTRG